MKTSTSPPPHTDFINTHESLVQRVQYNHKGSILWNILYCLFPFLCPLWAQPLVYWGERVKYLYGQRWCQRKCRDLLFIYTDRFHPRDPHVVMPLSHSWNLHLTAVALWTVCPALLSPTVTRRRVAIIVPLGKMLSLSGYPYWPELWMSTYFVCKVILQCASQNRVFFFHLGILHF